MERVQYCIALFFREGASLDPGITAEREPPPRPRLPLFPLMSSRVRARVAIPRLRCSVLYKGLSEVLSLSVMLSIVGHNPTGGKDRTRRQTSTNARTNRATTSRIGGGDTVPYYSFSGYSVIQSLANRYYLLIGLGPCVHVCDASLFQRVAGNAFPYQRQSCPCLESRHRLLACSWSSVIVCRDLM